MHQSRILFWTAAIFLTVVFFATAGLGRQEYARRQSEARQLREARFHGIFLVRDWFLNSLSKNVESPVDALLGGVLVGARSQLPKNITEDFRRTGLSHVMAISGYNISIISVMLMDILARRISRKRAFWVVLVMLGLFTILTGMQASVLRAAIMGLWVLFAQYLGRVPTPLHALTIAAAIMVGFDPYILRYDIGFQLSILATLGILVLAPRLHRKLPEVAAVTISAQLFVLPLIVYYFHSISIIALPANLVILPLIPPLMFFGFVAGIVSWIPLVGPVAGFLAWTLGKVILYIVHWFASIPWASISV